MNNKRAILACILPDVEGDNLKHFLINVALFAKQVDVDAHFLSSFGAVDLNAVQGMIPHHDLKAINMVSHTISEDWPLGDIGEAVKVYGCDLVVVPSELPSQAPSGRISEENGLGSRVRKYLFEQTSDPIMLLSEKVDLDKTPIGSILVPMSGEIRVSSALKFGLRLANRIHVPVDLVHVVIADCCTALPLEGIGDQAHHEYCDLLDRVLAEGSPFSDSRERAQVRTLYDVQGVPSVEILKTAKKTPSCAIVAEWHGSLIHGKAETLKDLLHEAVMPFFLVKAEPDQKSILKMGPEIRVA